MCFGPLRPTRVRTTNKFGLHVSLVRHHSRKGPGKTVYASRAEMERVEGDTKTVNYDAWSHQSLVQRVTQLEQELKKKNTGYADLSHVTPSDEQQGKGPSRSASRQFDSSKYHTRLVAFKLSYLGKNFNGFEHSVGNKTPRPTIEEELWKALTRAKLIFPDESRGRPGEINWEGCDYSKCGRTDRGVSAFGQVIGVRVRSNKPMATVNSVSEKKEEVQDSLSDQPSEEPLWNSITDEIPYAKLLNNLLPPEIRILAWCPHPPSNFSARFSCRERQYRYFFTQPAFSPVPTSLEDPALPGTQKDGWLDIPAMREAAKHYIGEHDFRNLCKIDASKQISNFNREVFFADIMEIEDTTSGLAWVNGSPLQALPAVKDAPKVFAFVLHGSAFLWHQVRHMVAVLFLVGQGLESPSIVQRLLDVETMPTRPKYEMATDTPLVLWDCIFPDLSLESSTNKPTERVDSLDWHHVGTGSGFGDQKYGSPGLMEDLWKVWRERKIDELLAAQLVSIVAGHGPAAEHLTRGRFRKSGKSQKIFDGSDKPKMVGNYVELSRRDRLESFSALNERYAKKKGFVDSAEMKLLGYRGQGTGVTRIGATGTDEDAGPKT